MDKLSPLLVILLLSVTVHALDLELHAALEDFTGEPWGGFNVSVEQGGVLLSSNLTNSSGHADQEATIVGDYNITLEASVSMYDTQTRNISLPTLIPIDSNATLYIIIEDTQGRPLEGQFCDVYATDSDGRVVKTFNTLPPVDAYGEIIDNATADYPATNTLGEYILSFLVDSDHFYYNHSYSLVAVCNGQTASQSFDVGLSRKQPLTRTMDEVRNDTGYWVLLGIGLVLGAWGLYKLKKILFKGVKK